MDRHVTWLRRRIITSIASQTAATFAVVALVTAALLWWRTDASPIIVALGALLTGQLIAVLRVALAMKNNPLSYRFMRKYVDEPFDYRLTAHDVDDPYRPELAGFTAVATVDDPSSEPAPVFDVFDEPSHQVAASMSRATGSLVLHSQLTDGRILVTDGRAVLPNERVLVNLAASTDVASIVQAHRAAISSRRDIADLVDGPQAVLDTLASEHATYAAIGPALSSFLDLEPRRSWFRLSTHLDANELMSLEDRLPPRNGSEAAAQPQSDRNAIGEDNAPLFLPAVVGEEAKMPESPRSPLDLAMSAMQGAPTELAHDPSAASMPATESQTAAPVASAPAPQVAEVPQIPVPQIPAQGIPAQEIPVPQIPVKEMPAQEIPTPQVAVPSGLFEVPEVPQIAIPDEPLAVHAPPAPEMSTVATPDLAPTPEAAVPALPKPAPPDQALPEPALSEPALPDQALPDQRLPQVIEASVLADAPAVSEAPPLLSPNHEPHEEIVVRAPLEQVVVESVATEASAPVASPQGVDVPEWAAAVVGPSVVGSPESVPDAPSVVAAHAPLPVASAAAEPGPQSTPPRVVSQAVAPADPTSIVGEIPSVLPVSARRPSAAPIVTREPDTVDVEAANDPITMEVPAVQIMSAGHTTLDVPQVPVAPSPASGPPPAAVPIPAAPAPTGQPAAPAPTGQPATLAEAIVSAPDSPAALEGLLDRGADSWTYRPEIAKAMRSHPAVAPGPVVRRTSVD